VSLISPTPHHWISPNKIDSDVTSEKSSITFTVYDGAIERHVFLGIVQIKPVLIHDHTVDQWYRYDTCPCLAFTAPILSDRVFLLDLVGSNPSKMKSSPARCGYKSHMTNTGYVPSPFLHYIIKFLKSHANTKTKRALTPRDFECLKLIGRGTFGKVFQVRKRDTRRIYAMKVLSKKEIVAKKEVAHTIGERKILQRSVESPFLVGLKFSFQTEADLYLVTDFKSGGELFWHLQRETRFSEERARFYVAELILALEHLHKCDIVYR
jgi:hypothetical protein